ncbi:MAG: hypothetical protein LBU51_03150 [Bacteroidales bacterium]|jgi:flagellar basal body-associated protein FliL|nr:hypothetical protein [Bacteroidales bacterium]
MKKYIYIAIGVVILGLVASTVIFWNQSKSRKEQLKLKDASIEILQKQLITSNKTIEMLGSLDAVRCEISFNVTNKAVFGKITNGDISQVAEAILNYTREELYRGMNDTIKLKK